MLHTAVLLTEGHRSPLGTTGHHTGVAPSLTTGFVLSFAPEHGEQFPNRFLYNDFVSGL